MPKGTKALLGVVVVVTTVSLAMSAGSLFADVRVPQVLPYAPCFDAHRLSQRLRMYLPNSEKISSGKSHLTADTPFRCNIGKAGSRDPNGAGITDCRLGFTLSIS